MEKRHSDTMTDRLEHVLDAGCVHILWAEISRWYGVEKIAARTYRDINERWQEVSGGESGPLQMVKGNVGFYLFAGKRIEPFPVV